LFSSSCKTYLTWLHFENIDTHNRLVSRLRLDAHRLVKTRPHTVTEDDVRKDKIRHAYATVTNTEELVSTSRMSEFEVNVMDALREWLCKQDTNRGRYWVHPFVQDRDDKNTTQN
jgi:hypothetical protein